MNGQNHKHSGTCRGAWVHCCGQAPALDRTTGKWKRPYLCKTGRLEPRLEFPWRIDALKAPWLEAQVLRNSLSQKKCRSFRLYLHRPLPPSPSLSLPLSLPPSLSLPISPPTHRHQCSNDISLKTSVRTSSLDVQIGQSFLSIHQQWLRS